MQKLVRWIFALVTAILLSYSCVQYIHVRQNLSGAQARLAELHEISARLREENAVLTGQIGALDIAENTGSGGADPLPVYESEIAETAN